MIRAMRKFSDAEMDRRSFMRQRTGETTKHHALRHAGATAAYLATRDLRAVQMFLGHAPMSTTQQHLHLDQDALLTP